MTETQHGAPQGPPIPERNPKAEAKAAKAYAKASRPWFKKKRFIIPLALLAIMLVSAVAGAGGDGGDATTVESGSTSSDSSSDSSSAEQAAEPEAAAPGIGDKVRDGKFQFTVTKVEPGVNSVGSKYVGKKAQGQFVLVHLTVKNIGDKAQTLFGDNQTLFIGGKEYSADTTAGIYLKENKTFVEEINPGNAVKGVIVFDVPKKATAFEKIELHDSVFSGGVDVDLSKS